MRYLELTENSAADPVVLTDTEARALAASELALISRTPGATVWEIAGGSKIGVVRVGDLQVTVKPKIPIDRLIFMLGYSLAPEFWRNQSVALDKAANLPEALAHTFARLATKALEQGLLQGYKTVDDSLPVVRGRIRVAEQIARRSGILLPIEVTYDDFTIDVAENQLLLAAVLRLLRAPGVSADSRRRLLRLRAQLAGVSAIRRGSQLPAWRPSRLNKRYQPALRVADLILAGNSFEQLHGDVEVSGFVLDMWKVFEDFVCVALREAFLSAGGRTELQHRMHLDRANSIKMKPDFLWVGPNGATIVADAKYKAEKPTGFPNADLYQMLAYCTVLGLNEGHLIYGRGNEDTTTHEVQGAGTTIHAHTLDLEQPPVTLLSQVENLAEVMLSLSTQESPHLTNY